MIDIVIDYQEPVVGFLEDLYRDGGVLCIMLCDVQGKLLGYLHRVDHR